MNIPKTPEIRTQRQRRNYAVDVVLRALEGDHVRAAMVKAGKQRDDLLRALIPLELLRRAGRGNIECSSGAISIFWKLHGVKIEASRVARAFRTHVGYARNTKTGKVITRPGVLYVSSALLSQRTFDDHAKTELSKLRATGAKGLSAHRR